jgi:hypothetical protein
MVAVAVQWYFNSSAGGSRYHMMNAEETTMRDDVKRNIPNPQQGIVIVFP